MDYIALAIEIMTGIEKGQAVAAALIAAAQAKGDPIPQELIDQHARIVVTSQRTHDLLDT